MGSRLFLPETAAFRTMRRLRYLLSRLYGDRMQNSQRTTFTTRNGQRFKRLILRDTALAAAMEYNLETFSASPHFPRVVIRYEHELWLEYVEGRPLSTKPDTTTVEKMADFYAALYRSPSPRLVDVDETGLVPGLRRDLHVLNRVGVLSPAVYGEIRRAAERLAPARVWIGFDYVDSGLKNFVLTSTDELICGIDAESLRKDQLIGIGVAKALTRWLGPHEALFFQRLFQEGVPDFRPYLPFVNLCNAAGWTKLYFFEKKWKRIRPELFDEFCKDD